MLICHNYNKVPAHLDAYASKRLEGRTTASSGIGYDGAGSCTSSVRVNTRGLPGDRHKGKKA